MEAKRDYKISYIRATATVMVVLLHIIQYFSYTYPKISIISDWLNLGLVMFFVISAFLYSKRDIKKQDYKKWISHRYAEIAVPATTAVIFALAYFYLLAKAGWDTVTIKNVIFSVFCGLGLEAIVPDPWKFMQYWFLTYILICYFTIPLIQKVNFKEYTNAQFWIGTSVISLFAQGALSAIHSPVRWGGLLRFYLAYAIFKRYDIKSPEMKKTMKILAVFEIPCILIVVILKYFMAAEGFWGRLAELIFIYTQTLVGISLFYVLYLLFGHIKEKKWIIKRTDRYSYYVYLTHCFFIGYNTSVIARFENRIIGTLAALILTAVASITVLFAAKPLLKRINNYIDKA